MKPEIPIKKNEHYNMKIDDIGNSGEGIGKLMGFTIFVEGALPEDEIEVRIIKIKKSFAFGKLMKIITPSPHRIAPPCDYAKRCGGCQLQHLSYDAQLALKTKRVKDALQRIGGLINPNVKDCIGMETPFFYRNKAQLPVSKNSDAVEIGFYAHHSHSIVDIQSCMLQHKNTTEIIRIVREFLNEFNISVYNEETHEGIVRHILTKMGFSSGEIMVSIVINQNRLPHVQKLVDKLIPIKGMTSISININKEKSNVILGKKTDILWGRGYITDTIGTVKFEISPLSFFQVNPVQAKLLYDKALAFANLSGDETVLDIYCGIGTISLLFAQKAKKVVGIEMVPEAVEDAKRNAVQNGITNASFLLGQAEYVIPALFEKEGFYADVIVIDPPRKGCENAVLDTMIAMKPKKIVYVSCDVATLARDLKILMENGYEAVEIQPIDQFCHTTHIEVVVSICRKDI